MIFLKNFLKDTAALIVGGGIFAAGLCMFAAPVNILTGGASGFAIILRSLTGIQIGTGIFLINIPLLITAFFVCGMRYTLKTVYAIFMFSAVIDVFEMLVPARYTGNMMLSAIYGGILTGIGMFIVLSRSIVTGGSDLLAYIIQRRHPGKTIGTIVLVIDGVIVATGALIYKSVDTALYSMTLIIIMTLVLNNLLRGRAQGAVHFIISDKSDEIRTRIIDKLDRGVSVIDMRGGYTGKSQQLLMCAVNLRESVLLRRLVFETDNNAFIIIADADRVCGNGFISLKNEEIY